MSNRSRDPRRDLLAWQTDRRRVLKGTAGAAAAFASLGIFGGIGAMPLPGASHPLEVQFQTGESPADAAPAANQVYRVPTDPTIAKVLDFYEMVYGRPLVADLFSDSLVRLDKNFQIIPGAALEWSSTPDGKTWTF